MFYQELGTSGVHYTVSCNLYSVVFGRENFSYFRPDAVEQKVHFFCTYISHLETYTGVPLGAIYKLAKHLFLSSCFSGEIGKYKILFLRIWQAIHFGVAIKIGLLGKFCKFRH